DMKEAVSTFTARAAEKLRQEYEIASYITVHITTNYFRKTDKQYVNSITCALPQPTSYTPLLTETALKGLERIFRSGYRYKKATVVLSGLLSEDTMQENLFHPVASTKDEIKLMKILDTINKEWGSGTLQYAGQGFQKRWKGKSENRSARFTTKWD